jgi:tetratricopeptide (TPR) repeat protein
LDQLDSSNGESARGYFFLGISLYKMAHYDQAIKAFMKSSELKADDA